MGGPVFHSDLLTAHEPCDRNAEHRLGSTVTFGLGNEPRRCSAFRFMESGDLQNWMYIGDHEPSDGSEQVAAGILACRRAGLPSPAERTTRKSKRLGFLPSYEIIHDFIRAARMPPSTAGRDACRHALRFMGRAGVRSHWRLGVECWMLDVHWDWAGARNRSLKSLAVATWL